MSSPDILSDLKTVLNHYLASIDKSTCVFISTMDGHLLLERSREDLDLASLAPMAGSLLGVSETIANTLVDQKLEDALIMMEGRTLGLLKIQDKEDSLYLGILGPRQVNLGKLLVNGKSATSKIKALLEEIPHE